jgi:hypothetical protein
MSFISASVKKVISLSIRLISLSFENLDKSNGNLLNLLFDKLMEESEFVWEFISMVTQYNATVKL